MLLYLTLLGLLAAISVAVWVTIARLLAERRRLRAALRESEARLRVMFDRLPFELYMLNEDGTYAMHNAACAENWGTRLGGRPEEVDTSDELRALWQSNNRRALSGQTVRSEEEVVVHGERRHIYNVLAPVRVGGKVTGVIGVNIDLTEQRQTAGELRRLLDMLHKRHAAVVALSENEAVRRGDLPAAARALTEAAARTVGVARAGLWLVGGGGRRLDCLDLLDADGRHHHNSISLATATYPIYFQALQQLRALDAADARTDPRTSELTKGYLEPLGIGSILDAGVRVGGETVAVLCLEHVGPLRVWTADEVAFVGELADLTAQAIVTEQLARHRDRLEEIVTERTAELSREVAERRRAEEAARSADKLKSAFLATMSHELRTPLNSILGFTGLLLKGLPGPLNDEQRKQLGMVQNSSRHLLSLINDVLDLSKIEAGQMVVRREPLDLAELVGRAIRTVTPLAEKKGLRLVAHVQPGLAPALGDARRVEQVLLNLLSNAIKFTERGEVLVRVEARGPWAVSSVRDSGIGIADADLEGLFQPFSQIDTGLSRRHEGTGLGLTICRRLVNMMGGAIRVSSAPGRGSTFLFTLPLFREAEPCPDQSS